MHVLHSAVSMLGYLRSWHCCYMSVSIALPANQGLCRHDNISMWLYEPVKPLVLVDTFHFQRLCRALFGMTADLKDRSSNIGPSMRREQQGSETKRR